MFASSWNSTNISTPPTLVATALPNSIALRVPSDNISPSVSSAQLDNNASGNRNSLPKANMASLAIALQPSSNESSISYVSAPSLGRMAQTEFLAQLASGDISPEVRGIFVQYEKLVGYGEIKYGPSDAGKPTSPASMFGTILPAERTTKNAAKPALQAIKTALPQLAAYKDSLKRNQEITRNIPSKTAA